jgi:hypothetical protein
MLWINYVNEKIFLQFLTRPKYFLSSRDTVHLIASRNWTGSEEKVNGTQRKETESNPVKVKQIQKKWTEFRESDSNPKWQ